MHNCKLTTKRVTKLLLDGGDSHPDESLSVELRRCSICRNEFDALKNTLRVTTRMLEGAVPSEDYWSGYHARLIEKLTHPSVPYVEPGRSSWLKEFFASSVRVPVPVGIGLIILSGLSFLFAIRATQKEVFSTPPVVIRVPVEVPVIQEKTVTRIVYRQRDRESSSKRSKQTSSPVRVDSPIASTQKPTNNMSLIGFKPLDEIKLTVIKGGSPDEK